MRVFVEIAEAAERLEELIELAAHGDEITICRDDSTMATLTYLGKDTGAIEEFLELAAEGRAGIRAGTTSDRGDLYDRHGLRK